MAGIAHVITSDSASGAQLIDGSLKFDSGRSQYLSRTPSSEGNRRTWTWSGWVKRDKYGTEDALFMSSDSGGNSDYTTLYFNTANELKSTSYQSSAVRSRITTNALFRDTGWYHIVLAFDLTQGTNSDKVKLYVNGSLVTSLRQSDYPSTNFLTRINSTNEHSIGRGSLYNTWFGDFGMSQVYFIDGQQLGPENFGFTDPLTNTWKPKKYTGSFTAILPGKSETDTYADSGRFTSYETFGTVTENDTGYTLPSSSWSHYGGKVKELDTGGFKITTVNSASEDFFMGCWVKFETYATDRQIGIDNFGDYVYWETQSNGAIGIRHNGGSRQDSSATSLNDGNWHHIALSRTGDTLYGFVDGTAVISTTSGVSNGTNSVQANENFWFFGGSGTAYNIDGQVIDPFVYIGQGLTSYTKPTSPLIDSSGSVNSLFGINSSYLYYASPGIDLGLSGGTAPNSFYLPMDGNSPIGKDQSGQGNDWTPVNFGGSVELDSPQVSGARPILNTLPGGTQAGVGVFGSKQNVGYAVTVYNDGGGNKYYIDGVKQATLTGLIRGATYTFDTSDSSNSGHPFRFSESDGGSEYTNGVAAITGTATTITIPYNSSNDLYYYCTNHSGMGSSITGITTNEKLADQYASHCVLALPLFGSNNDVSASIACTSTTKTVTRYNATAKNESSNFYTGSYYFDGTSDKLKSTTAPEFVFGTSDFTVEAWVYKVDSSNALFLGQTDNDAGGRKGLALGWHSGKLWLLQGNGSSWSIETQVGSFPRNKWVHIAASRDYSATKTYYFVDGQLVYTYTSNVDLSADTNNHLTIGSIDTDSLDWDGYIQDFRIYRGVAKYTSNFVPASTNPDILPDTPSGVSGGSKLTKITDGAVSFDGTGDFLGLANSTDTNFGSGDFTVECHAYFTSVSAETLLGQWENGSNRRSWLLQVNSGQLSCYLSADGTVMGQKRIDSASGAISTNRWYHLAYARSGDTMRLFIDGEQVGSVDVTSFTNYANTNDGFQVGSQTAAGSNLMSGFISNARIIKGTGIYTSRFTPPTAPLTNVTNTKLLCCQSPTSAIEGAVKPGTITANGDAAATNFNPFNTDINTVRGQETGYATWNPLSVRDNVTFSEGNLTLTNSGSGASGWRNVACTQSVTSGKWYVEMHTIGSQNGGLMPGVCKLPDDQGTFNPGTFSNNFPGMTANSYSLNCFNGSKRTNGSDASYGSAMAAGDMIMMCLDMDNGAIWWGKNGVWFAGGNPAANSNAAFTGLTGEFVFACGISASEEIVTNFGQKPFKFPPPDGFQPLNAANTRPVNVISRPDQYVGVTTYTGDNSASKKIDNLLFSPDLVWVKDRNLNFTHFLNDTVRGAGKILQSNTTTAETDNSDTAAAFPSFDPNGFTVGTNSNWQMNGNNEPYVAWCWKAGGKPTATNTQTSGAMTANSVSVDGVLQSAYTPSGSPSKYPKKMSIGTKQGFSIVQFEGTGANATVPHGLGKPAKFMIVKNMDESTGWGVYHDAIGHNGGNNYIELQSGSGASSSDTAFQDTAPTSDVFSVGSKAAVNDTNDDSIAYIWCDIPGLQKFGDYVANGNADGNFIELGFRPAILWIKATGSYSPGNWFVHDSERDKFNPTAGDLQLDRAQVEGNLGSAYYVDFLSNGFKLRADGNGENGAAGNTYIYCAWAEAPTVDLFGGGANAR